MNLTSRACVATYGLAAIFTGLSWRLCHLAIERHDVYTEKAVRAHFRKEVNIPANRGSILDIHGTVLARDEPHKTVTVDATLLVYVAKSRKKEYLVDLRPALAALIAKPLGKTPEEVIADIRPGDKYIRLQRKVSEQSAAEIEAALTRYEADRLKMKQEHRPPPLRGLLFEQEFERVYPARELLCHVLGFHGYETVLNPVTQKLETSEFPKGLEGVERSMDNWLRGQMGWRSYEKDGRGREIVSYRGDERAPRNGCDVRLTVDLGVQQIVEDELEIAYRRLRPKKAVAIVMDPHTGHILALANRPCFDPNKPCGDSKTPTKEDAAKRFNHAVAGVNEPGSTFKTISASLALQKGRYGINDEVWCYNGLLPYPGGRVKDHSHYGMLTVENVIAKSSNIGAVQLARSVGQEPFYDLIRQFGFGSQTGVALPGESSGKVHPLSRWRPDSIFHVPFGHEVSATPLQVITATCVFANGGKLMMPQIIRDVTDETGAIVADYKPQVVRENFLKPTVVRDIAGALEKVTSKTGTALRARVPGFRVAGKTSTTQLFDLTTGRYSTEDHTVSFVGYLPAEAPRFCILVLMEDSAVVNGPKDAGGLLAAPVFSKIAERTAAQLGIAPNPELLEEELQLRKVLEREGRL
jgi:cell division protein FtsI/penicillin-binding protein 2